MIKTFIQKLANINKIDYLVIFIFLISIFYFFYFTGTLTSGYHFTDDHKMIDIENSLTDSTLIHTVIDYVKDDLNIRFRPGYYLYYILMVKIFSLNFFSLSIFVGVLALFSFSFFYFGARRLGYSITQSFLFVLLMFVGSQASIWWRLGTNETIGIFFLGLSFLFMTKCLDLKYYRINNILFIIFLIITSLCKESFIIVIPAFIIYKIWNEKVFFNIKIRESIINNWLSILPAIIVFIELWIIKFVIGTNQIGYAGLTSSFAEFINGIKNIILNPASLLVWIKLLMLLIPIYLVSFLFIKENKKTLLLQSLKTLSVCFCFAMLIILPSIIMHAKSGMVERYLLPATFGLAFLVISIIQNTQQKFFKLIIIFITCIFVILSFNIAKTNAVTFTIYGRQASLFLSQVRNNSEPQSNILLVIDPVNRYEFSYSLKTYLSYYGLNNLYGYPMMHEYTSSFEKGLRDGWLGWFKDKNLEDIKDKPDLIIIFDKDQTRDFFSQDKVLESDYKNILPESSPQELYLKK